MAVLIKSSTISCLNRYCDEMILLVAFISFVFFFCWIRSTRNAPMRIWPLAGMVPELIYHRGRIHDYATEVLERGNGCFKFRGPWFSNMNFVVTSDYKNMQYMLSKKFDNFKRGPEFNEIFDAFGDGIFNADNELWKLQQKALHSVMKHNTFELAVQRVLRKKMEKGLFPILESFSQSGGSVLDIQEVLHSFTFDLICELVLGYDPGCLSIDFPSVESEKFFDELEEVIFRRHVVPRSIWKLEKWLDIGEEKKLKIARESFDNFLFEKILLIREKRKRESNNEEEFDLVTTLLEGYGEKSDQFLRDISFNLLAAGRDTVATAMTWLLWLVATHPSVEEKILKEIKEKLLSPDGEDNSLKIYRTEELSKLVYLHGAVCEALRLYPPVPFEHRAAAESDILPSGHRVGKNEKIFLCIYAMGRSSEVWGEDCLEFKPERWISEQGRVVHVPSYKFMPFLTGPRTCLGKDTAFYQIKSVVLSIIQNYHVKVVENHHVVPSRSMVLKMKHGLLIRLSKRQHY